MIFAPKISCISCASRLLMAACVPTGIKAGVWIRECAVFRAPARACESVERI